MSQEKVGTALGLTFQQIQNYESGASRVSASRLWDISIVLQCSVESFFEEMDVTTANSSPRNLVQLTAHLAAADNAELASERKVFVRAYNQIQGDRVRRQIYDLMHTIAAGQDTTLE
jgi:transcriptional regulator with XRE-family HTH domain